MSFFHRVVVLAALAVAVAQAAAASETRRVLQATDADGGNVVLISGEDEFWVRTGEPTSRLTLPPGAWLNRIAPISNGWIAGGARLVEDGQDLLIWGGTDGAQWEFQLPPERSGRIRQSVVPLVQDGRLAGIAWLEGSDFNRLAVRAATFDGADFGASETVSPPSSAGQVALQGAVLGDGSWLLVWSRSDADTTETVWSRRPVEGSWGAPTTLLEPNGVPDLTPAVIATKAGALASWSWFDGDTLRQKLARFDGEQWADTGYRGPPGSINPSFTHGRNGPRLLFREVAPPSWTVVELDARGNALRQARVEEVDRERPVISETNDRVSFRWPNPPRVGRVGADPGPEADRELRIDWEPFE